MSPDSFDRWRAEPLEPWDAYLKRLRRKQRLARYGVALAAVVLPSLLAWVTVGFFLGGVP